MKILVELEFNENSLGPKWMNPDNLNILLYTNASTKKDLLKVVSFEEKHPNNTVEDRQGKGGCKPGDCITEDLLGCTNKCASYPPPAT